MKYTIVIKITDQIEDLFKHLFIGILRVFSHIVLLSVKVG